MDIIFEAGRLKRELKALGFDPKMRWAGVGVFEVRVDGQAVYSKQRERKWPEGDEIAERIKRQGS